MTWQSVLYFLLWAGAFVLMMRFGCGAHVMGHGRRGGRGSPSHRTDGGNNASESIDPVCGMPVEINKAKSVFHRGRPYYFCSNACRDKFEASPESYTHKQAASVETKEQHHGSHC